MAKKVKTIPQLKKILWELCKKECRRRQQNAVGDIYCYTCGKRLESGGDMHTAHFIPSSVCGIGLRFDLDNLRVCCYVCNVHKSGNWTEYLPRMVAEVGQEKVDALLRRKHEFTKGDRIFYEKKIAELS